MRIRNFVITVDHCTKGLKENKLSGLILNETRILTQMAYHKKRWLSLAMAEFINIVKKHAELWKRTQTL